MVGWRLRRCLVLVYVRVIWCCYCFLRTSSVFLRIEKVDGPNYQQLKARLQEEIEDEYDYGIADLLPTITID